MFQSGEIMDKNELLKHIAETAYNVGYTAKLHFASHDMIEKIPGVVSFLSMAFGIYALAFEQLTIKLVSSTLLVFGIIGLYVSLNEHNKNNYYDKGKILTGIFDDLKHLILKVKRQDSELHDISAELKELESKFNDNCVSHQIMFASWFAHYKFFWEQQTKWIEDHRSFNFFRDKIPLTFWLLLITGILIFLLSCFDIINTLNNLICKVCK